MTEIKENQPDLENIDRLPETIVEIEDLGEDLVYATDDPLTSPMPRKRVPMFLIILGVIVLVLVLFAGGGFAGLRYYESSLLAQGKASLAASGWAAAETTFDQALSLQSTKLLADPSQLVLLRGKARFHQEKFDLALEDLAKAQPSYPDDAEVYLIQTTIFMKQGKMEEALKAAGEVLARDPQIGLPYALQAYQSYQQNKLQDAFTGASAAIERDDQLALAYRVRGSVLAWKLDGEAALADLNRALELEPDQPEALATRAYVYYLQHDKEKLKADAEALNKLAPDTAQAFWAQALMKSYEFEPEEATKLLDQAIQLDSNRPEYYTMRAESYTRSDQEKLALEDLTHALALNPDFAKAVADKAFYLFGRYEEVDMYDQSRRLLDLAPNSYLGHMIQGAQFARERLWDRAIAEADLAIQAQPSPIGGYLMRGDLYLSQKKLDEAKADYQKVIELDSESISAWLGQANIYLNKHEYDQAMKMVDEIAKFNPDSPNLITTKALILLGKENTREARKVLDEVFNRDPGDPGALFVRALISLQDKDNMKAMTDINKAGDQSPNDPTLMAFRASIYLADNDIKHALEELRKAEKIDKKLPDIYITRGYAYLMDGAYTRALENGKKAIKLAPWEAGPYALVGESYLGNNVEDQAIEYFQKSIELDPEQDRIYFQMGIAQWEEGNLEAAVDCFEKLMARKKTAPLEMVDSAEPVLNMLKKIPEAIDGIRTIEDNSRNYRLAFPESWIPQLPDDVAYSDFTLAPKGKENSVTLRVIINEFEGFGILPEEFSNYIHESLSTAPGYKFISRESFQGKGVTGIVDNFEIIFTDDDGNEYPSIGRMYIFISGKRYGAITYMAGMFDYNKHVKEADKIAASFGFID